MRHFINAASRMLVEDQPARLHDPRVVSWLTAAHARPDVDELYLHGSNDLFDRFAEPRTDYGKLIFGSKLVEQFRNLDYREEAFQAEYYGRNLYLIKISAAKPFRIGGDAQAKQIFMKALEGLPNTETMIRYNRFDYEYAYQIVPPAVAAGYDFFRIYEASMQSDSHGAAHADMITIIDRYESARQ